MKKFGEFLKKLRQGKGWSLRQMAAEIEVAPSYLSDIERGNRHAPTKEKLIKIIEILELNEDQRYKFYDLASQSKSEAVAEDVQEIMAGDRQFAVLARKIKKKGLNPSDIIKSLDKQVKDK